MAKTLVGRLQLVVQAMGLGEGKKVEGTLKSVEAAAKRLSNAQWGTSFQRQLEKMALGARQIDEVRRSWNSLERDISSRGLTAALKKSEISAWKTATIGHFAAIKAEMQSTESRAREHVKLMGRLVRPVAAAGGIYGGIYGGGMLLRESAEASAERQREYFRQRMGNIPQADQDQIYDRSAQLSQTYRAASINDIMEMARVARATMGDTGRGMQVLEGMVQSFVTLKSAKGVEAAASEISRMIRGIDNLGKNSGGAAGVKSVLDIIDGMTKAAQIEGAELDTGKLYGMALRAKIAGPGLSTDFIATTAAALMQDMTAEGFGTALSSGFKALVTGASDGASKVNLREQRRLGLRAGEGGAQGTGELVDGGLYGRDPYAWVKKYLVPALKADGVDMADDTAVATAVSKLSRNTMATGLWTRMITQQEQIDRNREMYGRSMGISAARAASENDPFVGWEGFKKSLENLSGAVGEHVMPTIVPGMNSLGDVINRFAGMVKSSDPRIMTSAGLVGAGVAAFGAWKVAAGIYGLITAGAALNSAAAALTAAAIAQGGGGIGAGAATAGGAAAGAMSKWGARLAGGAMAGWGMLVQGLGDTPGSTFDEQVANQKKAREALQGALTSGGLKRFLLGDAADEGFSFRKSMGLDIEKYRSPAGEEKGSGVIEDMLAGMDKLNSTTAAPNVDLSQLQRMKELVDGIVGGLARIGSAAAAASSNIDAQMRRAQTDYGVAP